MIKTRIALGWLMATAIALTLGSPAFGADEKVEKIKSAGLIRFCHIDYPPLTIKDPTTGKMTGLLVELAEAFAASSEVKFEHVDATWGTVMQNLQSDRCDVSAASTYVTAKRALEVLYTNTVTEDTQAAFVRADSGYKSYEELDKPGNVIAVISGSLNEANARTIFDEAEVKPIISERQVTTLLEVASGRADAAFQAVMGSLKFMRENPNVSLRPVDDSKLFPTPVAWMVPKGEYHLQQVINMWLINARASGELGALEKKWLNVGPK